MCLGMATGYIDKPNAKKSQSLLKPYTMNDKLNDMSIEEKVDELLNLSWCDQHCTEGGIENAIKEDCRDCIRKYLKSEVTNNIHT